MSKRRRLPPPERMNRSLVGPNVESFTVCSWCPTPDGSGKPEAVAVSIQVKNFDGTPFDLVLRLRTPNAVDLMIQGLLRHKRDVWPNAS